MLASSVFSVAYVAAWFILDKKPRVADEVHFGVRDSQLQQDKAGDAGVEVKAKVWQAGEPPRQALFDINQRFTNIEGRLRKIETYVTSAQFQLSREINRL